MNTNEKDKEQECGMSYTVPDAKVLLVDDNKINRQVFSNLLKKYELKIYEAEGGEECLAILEQQRFDIIFLDYMMPGMNGIETIRAIKANNLCDDTPIVMLTANAAIGENEEYRNEGFDAYLCKPIELEELDKVISRYLLNEYADEGDCKNEKEQSAGAYNLPQLDGFDIDYAMNILKCEDILLDTLVEFYYFLESLLEKLSELYDAVNQEETRSLYRIEVHALKSTAATVGALSLSELAKTVEMAAKDGNVEKISELHPVLLEEIGKHKERISVIMPESEDKIELESMEVVLPYFEMLKRSLKNNDYNTADTICDEIKKYKYPAHLQNIVDEIITHIMHLDADAAMDLIAKLKVKGGI